MIPLAVAQYFIGQDIYKKGPDAAQWEHDIHGPLAATIAVDYGIQAVTGIWNGVEDWGNPGQARRTVHSALMLLAGSWVFWTKMGLVALLLMNGLLLLRSERALERNPDLEGGWAHLRRRAAASVSLWLVITLIGTAAFRQDTQAAEWAAAVVAL